MHFYHTLFNAFEDHYNEITNISKYNHLINNKLCKLRCKNSHNFVYTTNQVISFFGFYEVDNL